MSHDPVAGDTSLVSVKLCNRMQKRGPELHVGTACNSSDSSLCAEELTANVLLFRSDCELRRCGLDDSNIHFLSTTHRYIVTLLIDSSVAG